MKCRFLSFLHQSVHILLGTWQLIGQEVNGHNFEAAQGRIQKSCLGGALTSKHAISDTRYILFVLKQNKLVTTLRKCV